MKNTVEIGRKLEFLGVSMVRDVLHRVYAGLIDRKQLTLVLWQTLSHPTYQPLPPTSLHLLLRQRPPLHCSRNNNHLHLSMPYVSL